MLDRVPWHTEETTVVVAPMFHAWGFSQLIFAASMGCTVVTRRKFDPEATLALIDRHRATGLCVVPVMFDRIMDLPDEVRRRYSGRSLRFATASGSRMRPDVVTRFMDEFGDIIYNNYNATEAGMIATATPVDLRAAPDTAGKPAVGTEIRILDADFREVPTGEVGQIFVRNSNRFDGYTTGASKDFHEGFMASGDVGRLDEAGRLLRGRARRRDDRLRRRERLSDRGGKDVDGAPGCRRGRGAGSRRRTIRATVGGLCRARRRWHPRTVDNLKQHVRDNLANYKVPREIVVLDELPRSSTGKIVRRDLLARLSSD